MSSVPKREPAGTYQAVQFFEEDNKPKCRILEFYAYISMEIVTAQWQRDSYVTDIAVYVRDAAWRRAFSNTEDALNVGDCFTWDPDSEGLTTVAEMAAIGARKLAERSGIKWYEVKVVLGETVVTERVVKDGPAQTLRYVTGWDGDCVGPGREVAEGECSDIIPRATAHNDRQREEAMEKYPEGVIE